jgi:hypothetical protein
MKKEERIEHNRFLEKFIQENWDEIEFRIRLEEAEREYLSKILC